MNDVAAPVVVTGASGHLGANLVRSLLAQQRRVRVLIRGKAKALEGLAVERATGDVLDPASIARSFAGAETVFHLAGKVSTGCELATEVRAVNVTGTKNVVESCLASGVGRLVHMSSIQALARAAQSKIDEIDESSPLLLATDRSRGVYDRSKAEAERFVLAAAEQGLSAVVLNPTAVIGPYDFQRSPMGQVFLALALGRLPALVAGAACDFVDVRDVAEAALVAEKSGQSGARYILSGTRLSLVDLARRWSDITGRRAPRFAAPMALARLSAPFAPWFARLAGRRPLFTSESLRVLRTQPPASRRKTSEALAYRPRPIEETLRDTWAWMKGEAWL
jgi:dihydroflavonol-4-reductase